MPKRFLRPGITSSKRWNSLDWITQSFFIRLITVVDDYGRFEADPRILRSACFPLGCPDGGDLPLRTDDGQMTDTCPSIDGILQSLARHGMVSLYQVGDTEYLQLTRWQERVRTPSKCPPQNDGQMTVKCQPDDGQMRASSPSPSPPSSPSPSPAVETRIHSLPPNGIVPVAQLLSALAKIYNKPDREPSTASEEYAAAQLMRERPAIQAELLEITTYRKRIKSEDVKFFPHSRSSLLEKWQQTLDRARTTTTKRGQIAP